MDNELKNAVKSEKKDKLANNPAQNTPKKPSKNPKGANYIINNVANDKRVNFSTKSNKKIIEYQLIFFVQFFNIILTVSSADISFEIIFSLSNPSKSFSFHQRFISCSV